MMPFSVLRLWFAGLLSWALLGAGVYLLYEWGQEPASDVAVSRVDHNDDRESTTTPASPHAPVVMADRDTAYLLVGLACVFLSLGGALPILPFLGRPPLNELHSFKSARAQWIDRPDGSKLFVEHYGPASAVTLVCTHGWSLDRTDWYFVRQRLGERYHLVLWDLAGLGKSSPPRTHDHSLEKMATDLQAVIDEATSGQVVLIGHSIGGMIQQTYSRLFPDQLNQRVDGLVFVHTTHMNPVHTARCSTILSALQKPLIEPLNYLTIWLSPLAWLSNWQSYANGSLHLTSRLTSFAGRQTWGQIDYASRLAAKATPAVVARGNLAMLKFDERATLPKIHVPALVVSGQHDRLTEPRASHTLAHLLPDATEVSLSPAGHLGHWEQHRDFERALVGFLEQLRPIAAEPDVSAPAIPSGRGRDGMTGVGRREQH